MVIYCVNFYLSGADKPLVIIVIIIFIIIVLIPISSGADKPMEASC